MSYWGVDGLETLREFEHNYGVLPRRMIVEIPEVAKFGMDIRGFFTLHDGDIKILMEILGTAIDESRKAMTAFDGSAFQIFSVKTAGRTFEIPSSTPVQIHLRRKLSYAEAQELPTRLDNEGYTVVNFHAEEGS